MKCKRSKKRANPVAKHAHQFNKAQAFRDRTKYRRRGKHPGKEPCLVMSLWAH
ncbi:MAG: DUF7230 family protein [Gammaproteobacteria bacterium]